MFIFLAVLLFVFYFTRSNKNPTSVVTINDKNISVEVADTDEERTRGLSGRKSLEENHGMLFIFPQKSIQRFWMKDMNFPIDIVWIDGDKIVGFDEYIPPEGSTPQKIYSSPLPVNKVLELPSGTVEDIKIKKGDKLILSLSS
ncbi:hypothetical protein A2773_05865 [Candidatus Gottesmanbacteria bacterium RIFCSPHIGHO2_01_FULL_39_10]|uniref:DUF192 domain-containing protein n=1 Tax=Candidatus Gottesmanbacteria bacterium RIFCSPHIGHO2_01_FULL_39_10 TaxID=1798375 RepID=A0A1F5ZKY4_9BACT|nr:MAG: hypothetical protein A2773_05865 [Candidatus Gottesmanbacteria bacterium RIFCSPHIGHO2_01_FULL_39_10]